METPQVPGFTLVQVEYLERLFPSRCPDMLMTNRAVWAAVGRAEVAKHVRGLYNQQVQKDLARK